LKFLTPLVNQAPRTAIPVSIDMDMNKFHKYKAGWLLYRSCGSFDASGNFVRSIDYLQARQIPKEELDIYFELDDFMVILQRESKTKT